MVDLSGGAERRAAATVRVATLVGALLALTSACGGATDGITVAQWKAVPIGSTRQAVIARLGHGPAKQTVSPDGSRWIFYDPGNGRYAGFAFDPVSAKLVGKKWIQLLGTSSMGLAAYRGLPVSPPPTAARVVAMLGSPAEQIVNVRAAGHSTQGRSTRCLRWVWAPRPGYYIEYCFSSNGRLVSRSTLPPP